MPRAYPSPQKDALRLLAPSVLVAIGENKTDKPSDSVLVCMSLSTRVSRRIYDTSRSSYVSDSAGYGRFATSLIDGVIRLSRPAI